MCFAVFLLPWDSVATQSVGLTVIAIASALLIFSSFESKLIGRFLSTPALVFTGKISYGWYLWHWPLMLLATFRIERHGWIEVFVLAASIVLSYVMAVASYFLIELPFLRLKKKYSGAETAPAVAYSGSAGCNITGVEK
jgi:peptidoglycan/LPS O-acetylase OafA/YrhL